MMGDRRYLVAARRTSARVKCFTTVRRNLSLVSPLCCTPRLRRFSALLHAAAGFSAALPLRNFSDSISLIEQRIGVTKQAALIVKFHRIPREIQEFGLQNFLARPRISQCSYTIICLTVGLPRLLRDIIYKNLMIH